MATNLSINQELLNEALQLSGLKTKRETVNLALEEFIRRRKTIEIIDLFGTIDYDEDCDYKAMRQRSSCVS